VIDRSQKFRPEVIRFALDLAENHNFEISIPMTPDDVKQLVETTVNNEANYAWIYLLLSGVIALIVSFLMNFVREKSKNLATRQDIEFITSKIEQVKADVQNNQEVLRLKRELKYNALLHSLEILDAHLSNFIIFKDGPSIDRQFSTASEARQCHNSLILTCENPELVDLFLKIMFAESGMNMSQVNTLFDDLNAYRNLVRKELEFGSDLILGNKVSWLLKANFVEKKNER